MNCLYDPKVKMHVHGHTKDGRTTYKCPKCNFIVREGTLRFAKINRVIN